MKKERLITVLVVLISVISAIAAGIGIFSDYGTGAFEYKSIRGTPIGIYGKGIYQHMSADVAIIFCFYHMLYYLDYHFLVSCLLLTN